MSELLAALRRIGDKAAVLAEQGMMAVPFVRRRIQREYDRMLAELEPALKPYNREQPPLTHLPATGRGQAAVLAEIAALAEREAHAWRDGLVSGAVYHGDAGHITFLNQVYALTSQVNPLHADLWPSAAKFEAEIVAMTAAMLGGGQPGLPPEQQMNSTRAPTRTTCHGAGLLIGVGGRTSAGAAWAAGRGSGPGFAAAGLGWAFGVEGAGLRGVFLLPIVAHYTVSLAPTQRMYARPTGRTAIGAGEPFWIMRV